MKADGSEYYEYILLYTDDAIVVSENAEHTLRNKLGKYWTANSLPWVTCTQGITRQWGNSMGFQSIPVCTS